MNMRASQRGLTLVELMIAITLGMLVVAAVAALYVNASRSFREDDQYARLLENGRFSIHFLGEDLQLANFWGYSLTPHRIEGGDATVCGVQPYKDSGSGSGDHGLDNLDAVTCDDKADSRSAILLIKRVSGTMLNNPDDPSEIGTDLDLVSPHLVVRAKSASVQTGTYTLTGEEWVWPYKSAIYFVKKDSGDPNDPQLCRIPVGQGSEAHECLLRGVEHMRILYGIDDDGDGRPEEFMLDKDAGHHLENAVSARVCLVVRSERELSGFDNSRSYKVCGTDWIPSVYAAPDTSDGYQRRVFEKTFQLRNNASMSAFNE